MNELIWVDDRPHLASSRPPNALLSSSEIVFSWPTPPPLSSSASAPKTSSISGLRPEFSRPMTSPSPSLPVGSGGLLRETNFSPSRLVCRISARALSGRSTMLRQLHGDVGGVAVELDRGDLADRDVVDLDGRLRDQVQHVAEHDVHGDRVAADVGAARAAGCRTPSSCSGRVALTRVPISAAIRRPRGAGRRALIGATSPLGRAPLDGSAATRPAERRDRPARPRSCAAGAGAGGAPARLQAEHARAPIFSGPQASGSSAHSTTDGLSVSCVTVSPTLARVSSVPVVSL